jgi:DNA-directed RNA polymerase beta subunit
MPDQQPTKSVTSPVNASVEPSQNLPGMKFIGDVLKREQGNLASFDDFPTRRNQVFSSAAEALKQRFPISNNRYTLQLTDVGYADENPITLKEQKEAVLNNLTLSKKLQGRWTLKDNVSGAVIDKTSKRTVLNVPYLTDRGTFIRNGTEYALINQFRLIPGVFSKWTDDGKIEAHVNVKQGTGNTFKVYMEPSTAEFYVKAKNRKIKLYPVLRALGTQDSQLEEVWGKDILDRNKKNSSVQAVRSAMQALTPSYRKLNKTAKEDSGNYDLDPTEMADFKSSLMKSELDPDATHTTLGARHNYVSPALFMDVTKKLIKMSRNESVGDDRDSLEFQRLYGAPQYVAERILKDPGNILKGIMWKATNKGNLSGVSSGVMNKYLDALYNTSGLGQAVEEINPFDMLDQSYRVTRMGEGGISDTHQIPDEARAVQPTYRGFVDPIRSPESEKVGVDLRLTHNVKIGEDGILYREMMNPRTGKREVVSSVAMAKKVVGFPESFKSKGNYAPAMVRGEGLKYVPKKDIDYVMEHGSDMFSLGSNLVPLHSGVKGMRLLMGAKMISQALPLVSREAPLVRPSDRDGNAFNSKIEKYMGTRRADQDGVVKKVTRDGITMQYADGKTAEVELYDNFPFARKSGIKNSSVVKEGQKIRKGDLLATSNYTDKTGYPALGTNLNVAYMPYKGYSFEDGIVLSESAAKKLTSEHTYATKVREEEGLDVGRNTYMQMYPGKFTEQQYKNISNEGVVKPGTVVNPGDPLVLAVKSMPPSIRTLGRKTNRDYSEIWDYPEAGVVTDVVKNKDGWHVYVRANSPAKPADKLAGLYGNKGVVSHIIPDGEMPHDKDGKPYDILLNPLGVVSRTNSAQLVETALGKIAARTGKPYTLPGFTDDPEQSLAEYAMNELKKHNMSDTEDIWDPTNGKKIPNVFTGVSHFYKLQHTAEAKSGSHAFGGYTLENQPSPGGKEGAKRIGGMEVAALVSHGARNILQDMKMIRGQKNDDYWRDLKAGKNPTMPRDNFMFNKFLSSLKAAGIQVDQDKDRYNIFAMTNDQLKNMVGPREIQSSDTFDPKHFKPIPGGLFDEKLTGGTEGDKFSYMKLDEPMLNPIMETMAKRVLGFTERQFEDMLSGVTEYKGKRGGEALKQKLADVDLKSEIIKTVQDVRSANGTKRDNLVKKLRALKSLEEHDTRPEDFMFDRIPVIPPKYRPISASEDMTLASDFNYLYRELMFNRNDLKDAREKLPDEMLSDIRKTMYNNFKALTGLGDSENVELKEKGVSGILKHIFGKQSPKFGMFQRKMVGGAVDLSARTAITPNPNLKLNQVGLPESVAWELYEPFVIRQMVRHGTPMVEAAKAVANKDEKAAYALKDVMKERPVLINRAPTMHKWGFMACWPVLTKGHTLQVSVPICGPFNADFDGDTMAIHVPVSDSAVKDAKTKMLPEKNLMGARDYSLAYAPSNEYVQGAYLATKNPHKGLPVTFETEEDAVKAYRSGKIDVDTPVKIKKRKMQ